VPTRNPSDRYYSDDYNARPVNRTGSARPAGAARPAGSRPAGSARPAGSRPAGSRPAGAARPAGSRPAGSARPDSRYGSAAPRNNPPRRPQKKRRKAKGRFYAFVAIAVIIVIALILIIAKPFGGKKPDDVKTQNPVNNVTAANDPGASSWVDEPEDQDAEPSDQTHYSSISDYLADADAEVEALSEAEMAQVANLSINENLPSDWMNILLLGTDERTMSESSRTDTMMICSINKTTGEVKLTSLMRDLNVPMKDIGKYSGEYRLNAAHYFGGAKYAMKLINECFGMNIQYYVRVNFFGFQKIAQALGGIDISITEEEMKQINKGVIDQVKQARKAGIDESDLAIVELTQFGENTHLDGRQTLAYARIRKTDNDYERTRRQRTVLNELLKKVKQKNPMEIITLATSMMDQVKTNMDPTEIINVALVVMNNGLGDIENMRLPVNGTYKEERRNNDSRLWDCDWQANELALYNFIYE